MKNACHSYFFGPILKHPVGPVEIECLNVVCFDLEPRVKFIDTGKVPVKVHQQKILLAILLACLGSRVVAQRRNDPGRDSQIWPDTSISIKLDQKLTLVIFGTIRLGRDDSAAVSHQAGIGINRRFSQKLSGGVHYRFVENEPTPNRLSTEHRLWGELTPRTALKFGFNVSDRNRMEWRNINDKVSWRYRNRLQFERPLSFGEHKITPYISGETMYDTRYRTWNRSQVYVGARIPLAKHVTFDGFYMRQFDARALPGFLHVIGTFWRLEF